MVKWNYNMCMHKSYRMATQYCELLKNFTCVDMNNELTAASINKLLQSLRVTEKWKHKCNGLGSVSEMSTCKPEYKWKK